MKSAIRIPPTEDINNADKMLGIVMCIGIVELLAAAITVYFLWGAK